MNLIPRCLNCHLQVFMERWAITLSLPAKIQLSSLVCKVPVYNEYRLLNFTFNIRNFIWERL